MTPKSDRCLILDQSTENAAVLRQPSDGRDRRGIHAGMDELLEGAVRADDGEGGVPRPGDGPSRLDHAPQHDG